MNKIQNNIKKVKIILENPSIFWERIEQQKIPQEQKDFLNDCINLEVTDKVDLCDVFYLDKYMFDPIYRKGYNFYNYSQKLSYDELKKIKKFGFKNFEINYFNYDLNGIRNNKVIKKGTKLNISNYYEYLKSKKIILGINKQFILFKYYPKYNSFTEIDYIQLREKILYFWKHYKIWANSINIYSLRKNLHFYDPDMFYLKENIKEIKNLNSKNFEENYIKYKLRPKTIVYKVKYYLDKQAISFLYHSYHILESMARIFKKAKK